jgi:hypothetical protein
MPRSTVRCPIVTETRNIAPGVWTRLPNGITIMQPDTPREDAVCTVASDGTVTLSSGATWHVRT